MLGIIPADHDARYFLAVMLGPEAGRWADAAWHMRLAADGGHSGAAVEVTEYEAKAKVTKVCSHCQAEGARHKCGRCKSAFYCSRECQRAAWRAHRARCEQFCLLRGVAASAASSKTQ